MRAIYDGVVYDTDKSTLIINRLYVADGCWYDLMRTDDGRYYLAQYSTWEHNCDTIDPVDEIAALDWLYQYEGTILQLNNKLTS